MVRTRSGQQPPSFTTGDHLLLFPEDAPSSLESPTYVHVTRVRRTMVEVEDDDEGAFSVPKAVAEGRRVPADEATGSQPGVWLRKAVRVECSGSFYYGQAIAYSGSRLTVDTGVGRKTAALGHRVEEVYPVLAMVMGTRRWLKQSWPATRLRDLENRLFERLQEGEDGSPFPIQLWLHDWARLFGDLTDLRCQWTDPSSGRLTRPSLWHVVQFAFYVDGHRALPVRLRAKIGASFCDDPRASAQPREAARDGSETSFFDPLEDDDDDATGGSAAETRSEARPRGLVRAGGERTVDVRAPDHGPVTPAAPSDQWENRNLSASAEAVNASQDIEIIELLRQHKPHLLSHYLSRESDRSPRKRARVENYSAVPDPTSKRPRQMYQPTSDQDYVHRLFTAEEHQGKSSDTFLEYLLASPAVQFYTHPGVVARLYDLRFGRGLSIKHFRRIGLIQKLQQLENDAVNPSDYTVAAPAAPVPSSWAELGSATRSFVDYSRELCDTTTVAVAEALDRFVNTLEGWQQCDIADLPLVVTWIDSLLDRYRKAATYDTFHATKTRAEAPSWFSVSNPELHTLMISALGGRLRVAEGQVRESREALTRGVTKTTFDRKIPADVSTAIPMKDGKEVCLHFLSKKGCKSSDPDKCTFKNRAHFWPETIPPKLRQRPAEPGKNCPATAATASPARESPTSIAGTAGSQRAPGSKGPAPACITDVRRAAGPPVATPSANTVRCVLERQLRVLEQERDRHLHSKLQALDIEPPTPVPNYVALRNGRQRFQVDRPLQAALTALVTSHGYSVPELVELVRGQTATDYRPNKALCPSRLARLLRGYRLAGTVCTVAARGITPRWKESFACHTNYPKNHQSANRHLNAVLRSIRRGQDAGQYLVLSEEVLDHLDDVHLSPLGAVTKKDTDPLNEIRLIHDLSYPRGISINDASTKDQFPEIEYRHVAAIARRIEFLARAHPGRVVRIMKGDVKSAFRHLMLASAHVGRMGARIPQLKIVILDMSAPFGWTGSPSYYGAFGGAISWLVSQESPMSMTGGTSSDAEPFFAYEWVDDHVLVEVDTPHRLAAADEALRLAMMAVLGPRAINDDKFTAWSTEVEALGLIFNTCLRTVAIPASKIYKALDRVTRLETLASVTRNDLECLLGSLRHICCCLRSAKPFFQRVHAAAKRAPRRGQIPITPAIRHDLQWFKAILSSGCWDGLPLSLFGHLPPAEVHLYMDASDHGLAVLDPARHRFIQFQFTAEERSSFVSAGTTRGLDINARELFCAALATVLWGPSWTPALPHRLTHVQAWSDNASAVSWINKLNSTNPYAQELVRSIGLSEARYRFRMSASHLPGSTNVLADAGSHTSSRKSPQHVQDVLRQLQTQALAGDSRRKYSATWQQWTAWCQTNGYSPWLSGTRTRDSDQLIQFALWCWQPGPGRRRNTASTILSKVGHISWYHRCFLGFPVGLHAGHQLAMQGMQKLSAPPSRKRPFTVSLLRHFRCQRNFDSAHDRVLWGAAVMGFFYMLRRSEYLSDKGTTKLYAIQLRDVTFRTSTGIQAISRDQADSVIIRFRGSKTDQVGVGATRSLERSGSRWLCPVSAVWELVRHGRRIGLDNEDPLCSITKAKQVSASDMAVAIKEAARAAGEDPELYGTHSMRSGGATALFSAGVDRLAIKHFGRWKSDSYEQYARIDNVTVAGLAAAMATGD